jgi:hypothetical protein
MKIKTQKKYSILHSLSRYVSVFAIVFAITMPFVVFGDGGGSPNKTSGVSIDAKINNPLSSNINSIPAFIEAILNIVLTVGIPIVVLAIIYCGFLFVQAQGNAEELKKAKKAFIYTLIGAALLLGAFVIAHAIKGTIDEITKNA